MPFGLRFQVVQPTDCLRCNRVPAYGLAGMADQSSSFTKEKYHTTGTGGGLKLQLVVDYRRWLTEAAVLL